MRILLSLLGRVIVSLNFLCEFAHARKVPLYIYTEGPYIYIYRDCKVPVYFSWVNISSLGQEELSFSVSLFVSRAIEHIHPPMTRASSERSGRGGFRGHSAGHCRVADTSPRMLRVVLRLFRPFAPNLIYIYIRYIYVYIVGDSVGSPIHRASGRVSSVSSSHSYSFRFPPWVEEGRDLM
jgi:hypothetical protein